MAFDVAQLLDKARGAGLMIATAESCTSGLIAGALGDVPGASDVLERGFVTYSNAAKFEMLGVKPDTLDTFGAVSEQVAGEMAKGAVARSKAQLAIAVTGIAGPGGSDHKPEGMVCFGISDGAQTQCETIQFGALGRTIVRAKTVEHALQMLLDWIETQNA